jgi:hypothetical protein
MVGDVGDVGGESGLFTGEALVVVFMRELLLLERDRNMLRKRLDLRT